MTATLIKGTEIREQILKEIEAELGHLTLGERIACWATLPLVALTSLTAKLKLFQQPRMLRLEYNGKSKK